MILNTIVENRKLFYNNFGFFFTKMISKNKISKIFSINSII